MEPDFSTGTENTEEAAGLKVITILWIYILLQFFCPRKLNVDDKIIRNVLEREWADRGSSREGVILISKAGDVYCWINLWIINITLNRGF